MNQPSTQDLRASLLGLFESSDALFGAQIVPLLKNKFATVRFGPPGLKLSEFISEHVPEIVEDRNPGSDSIYRLSAACGEEPGRKDCSHGESVKKRASRDELEVLKTFSSPHGNRKIVVNTDRKILKVIPSRQDVSPGCVPPQLKPERAFSR